MVKKISGIEEFDLNKDDKFIKKISPVKLKMFLRSILNGEINNKDDAMGEYLENIDNDYNLLLKTEGAKKVVIEIN